MTTSKFEKVTTNSFLFGLFLLYSLPAAFIAGIRVKELNEKGAVTTVKYKWLTQNPFKSIYFAVLAMAAELSTGILLIRGTNDSKPAISMLIVKNSASYYKKAVGTISFTCKDGDLITQSIKKAKETGQGVLIDATTTGRDQAGDIVAEFAFTWSIKAKA